MLSQVGGGSDMIILVLTWSYIRKLLVGATNEW